MKTIKNLIGSTALIIVLAAPATQAQQSVDIGLHAGDNGHLEVRVIPHEDFDGIFSNLVFSLRWDRSTGARLGEPLPSTTAAAYMPLQRSGGVHENGNANYQIYTGIGMQRIAESGTAWKAGQAYTVAVIPVTGQAEFELLNDAWTGDERNNGDFYVSLAGRKRTGQVVKSLAVGGLPPFSVEIMPNPNNGRFAIVLDVPEEADLTVEIVNSLGVVVHSELLRRYQGAHRHEMNLTSMSQGAYYMNLRRGDETVVRKILFQ